MAGPTWLIHPGWGVLAHSWRGRGRLHALHRGSLTLNAAEVLGLLGDPLPHH